MQRQTKGTSPMSWTDERVEQLKRLWAEGLSASQIAAELGSVTRNAVIGKVHRLSLSGRAKQPSGGQRPRRPRMPRSEQAERPMTIGNNALKMQRAPQPKRLQAIEDVVVPIPLRTSILALGERTCRWPIGDPADEDFSSAKILRPARASSFAANSLGSVLWSPMRTNRPDFCSRA